MASCITSMWSGSVCPQARLTVTQSSETNTTATLSWTLEYVTHGYTASTNGYDRAWSVTIDGSTVDSGGTNINGKSTYTVASGTKTVNKAAARSVSFSLSFEFDITWSDVYGGTKTASGSIDISAAKYTVSFNANGGSGAPSAQTKTHGTDLTLSSTKPTKTGYTFAGWGTSTSDTTVDYTAGGKYTSNASDTLYAIWTENALTVNYYSNYADYCTHEGSSVAVSASTNVLVASSMFYYDNSYTNGLADVQNKTYLYLSRTGYTPTGNWGTSTSGGTLINQTTSFSTGQAVAQAFGKTLASGNQSVNVYVQWSENYLTVNMYSNYATSAFDGAESAVGADKNVLVKIQKFYYDNEYSNGLANYSNSSGAAYMTRTGYTPTGFWNTKADGSGTSVDEDTEFTTGQKYAEAFGLSLATSSQTVNVYAQWRENTLTVNYYSNYATSAFDGAVNEVGADKNVIIRTHSWTYTSDALSAGLHNYSSEDSTTYLARTRYDAVGYWGTVEEVYTKDDEGDEDGVISNENGIAVSEDKSFSSGQELAEVFGLTLEDGDKEIDLYAQWVLLASRVTVHLQDGSAVRGLVHIYDDSGNLHYGILTIYDQDGNARVVI